LQEVSWFHWYGAQKASILVSCSFVDGLIPNTVLLALKKLHEAETTSLQVFLTDFFSSLSSRGRFANGLFSRVDFVSGRGGEWLILQS
jgi:hypothetical protein